MKTFLLFHLNVSPLILVIPVPLGNDPKAETGEAPNQTIKSGLHSSIILKQFFLHLSITTGSGFPVVPSSFKV